MLSMIPKPEPSALAGWARRCGLPLTVREAAMVLNAYSDALSATGRIEIEPGGPEALIEAFASSTYLDGAETLCALSELFFHLKNAADDRISDERLLGRMAEVFDDCHGCPVLTADRMEGEIACLH